MKKVIQTIILIGAVLVVLFTSCSKKGDKGPAGQQGAQGNTGEVSILTDGYIKGTISGFRMDGTAFTETFTYTTSYSIEQSSMDSISPTSYDFNIAKGPMDHLYTEFSSVLNFNASSLSPVTITSASFRLSFAKLTGTNEFVFSTTSSGITPTITNVVYDKNTGVITGNYIVNVIGSQNSTGNGANINGSFKATMAQTYYRTINNTQPINFN
jgi:hypothetical protein